MKHKPFSQLATIRSPRLQQSAICSCQEERARNPSAIWPWGLGGLFYLYYLPRLSPMPFPTEDFGI